MTTTAEFDAFGPWIYEIRTKEDVPRLYRDYPLDLDNAVLTIKVPRDITRREANPSMDLYDVVLSLGQEKATVLRRSGTRYDFRDVPYQEIQGITEFVDLLAGRLTLATDAGDVVVPFNASSSEIVTHLVQLLRERYLGDEEHASMAQAGGGPVPDVERELQGMFRRLAHGPGDRVLAVQHRRLLVDLDASIVGRVMARAWPTWVLSSIIVLSPQELQVLHRGRPYQTGYKPVRSLARTLIPLERVTGVETRPSSMYEGITKLVVRAGSVSHEFAVDNAHADGLVRGLREAIRG
ncbi:MAG: hypothetical protein EOL91_04940 [Actinobacteria bacterium]|nr:hypothetical protein [Actinomycetota bacterium]